MNNLALLNVEITMTSLEVVDLINKFREEEGSRGTLRHDNFMASIRKEIESLENAGIEVNALKIKVVEYTDRKGEKRPCYRMDRS